MMKQKISFEGVVRKFPGPAGWVYLPVPKKHTKRLKERRRSWGMYPITVSIGNTSWKTKLMTKKGGDFFVALKSVIRNKGKMTVGNKVVISFVLE